MPGLDPAGFRPGDHGVLHFVSDVFFEQDILFQEGSPFVLAAERTLHLEGAPAAPIRSHLFGQIILRGQRLTFLQLPSDNLVPDLRNDAVYQCRSLQIPNLLFLPLPPIQALAITTELLLRGLQAQKVMPVLA